MAITPVGDIVHDVARAAEPTQARAAALGLSAGAARTAAGEIADPLGAAGATVRSHGFDAYVATTNLKSDTAKVVATSSTSLSPSYQKLEAMLLQTYIETMMPKNSDAVFGKGVGGAMWKSLMAEQIGAHFAKSGGVGIARLLEQAARNGGVTPT